MVAEAKARGLELTGPNGLLKLFTRNVVETALREEMTEHLGHEKYRAEPGRESTNIRNGTWPKTVISDAAGEVRVEVPRDREGSFEPRIVRKRQRRIGDVDEIVLSLYAKGLTAGEISAHFADIYGASVSRETVSRITDKVVAEMEEWAHRPLDAVYAAVFIDAIVVKVRDGQVANRPVYAVIGVTVDGHKDVLGLWMGTGGGEGAKFWMSVLVDLKNRGVRDVFFLVCDGLKSLPEVVTNVWPDTIVQTCIIHLIRNSFRLVSRKHWDGATHTGWFQPLRQSLQTATRATTRLATLHAARGDVDRARRWAELGRAWAHAALDHDHTRTLLASRGEAAAHLALLVAPALLTAIDLAVAPNDTHQDLAIARDLLAVAQEFADTVTRQRPHEYARADEITAIAHRIATHTSALSVHNDHEPAPSRRRR